MSNTDAANTRRTAADYNEAADDLRQILDYPNRLLLDQALIYAHEHGRSEAATLDVLRRLVDAVDHQLRRYRATAGWGDSPLSEAIDDARLLLAAARPEVER
jgi:hypothetical protein